MVSTLYIILALFVVSVFFGLMIFSTVDRNRLYIQYVLLAYPFMAIDLVPRSISPTIFDFTTLAFVLLFYKPRQNVLPYRKIYLRAFILLTVVVVVGLFNAENLTNATISALIQYAAVFSFAKILVDECFSDDTFIFSVLNALKVALVVSLLFLGAQFIFGTTFTFERFLNANVTSGLSTRYPSFFQDPQKYAQFLAVSSLLLLIYRKKNTWVFYLNMILLVMSVLAMMFTGGRAALGGWLAGIALLLLFGNKKYRFAVLTAGMILLYVVYTYFDSFPMFNRLSSLNDDYEFRYSIWEDAFGIFKNNPVFGIGVGNYSNYVSIHNPDQFWMADNAFSYFDHPESGYLKILTEYGIIGFIAISGFFVMPVVKGVQSFFKTRNTHVLTVIAALISWMVGFYTLYSFDDSRIRILTVTVLCLLITSPKWSIADAKD